MLILLSQVDIMLKFNFEETSFILIDSGETIFFPLKSFYKENRITAIKRKPSVLFFEIFCAFHKKSKIKKKAYFRKKQFPIHRRMAEENGDTLKFQIF